MFTMAAGIVMSNWDKDHPGQLQVEYALGEEGKSLTDWIPVMTDYAGPGYGRYALPEVGCEVVVGFLHNNCDQPFVMGCLWGRTNTLPDETACEDNPKKLFRGKGGFQVLIDEKEKQVNVTSSDGESSLAILEEDGVLSADAKTKLELKIGGEVLVQIEKDKITLMDHVIITDNVEVKADKIAMEAQNELSAKGKTLSLEGTDFKAEGKQMKLKGNQFQAEGQQMKLKGTSFQAEGTSLELKAQASGKFQASGILEVKGAMVKIN